MRIPSKIDAPERPARVDRSPSADKKAAAPRSTPDGAGVRATVSARARSLADDHAVDEAKVERLRESIDNGTFRIDHQRIAERIVERG